MLKLQPLPDRVPVKLTITLSPDLKKALDDYALALRHAPMARRSPLQSLYPS